MEQGQIPVPMCHCGDVADMKTSWTIRNPGRDFFGCRHHGVSDWKEFMNLSFNFNFVMNLWF